MRILFFDTETTGLPRNYNAPISQLENWPRMVEFAGILADEKGELVRFSSLVKPDGFTIPAQTTAIHGISTQLATEQGMHCTEVLSAFSALLDEADALCCHNATYDVPVILAEALRYDFPVNVKGAFCTKEQSTNICCIPSKRGGYKWPKLKELHEFCFGSEHEGQHTAFADAEATMQCFFALRQRYPEHLEVSVLSQERIKQWLQAPLQKSAAVRY